MQFEDKLKHYGFELAVLFMAVYALFAQGGLSIIPSGAIPAWAVSLAGGLYVFLRFILPQIEPKPAQQQDQAQLQSGLQELSTTLTALNASHVNLVGQVAQIADRVAQLLPQQTSTTSAGDPPAPTIAPSGGQ